MKLSKVNLGKVAVTVDRDWDNTKDYDKLTIVLDRSVYKTYISRKPVPAGTVLTNMNYWLPFSSLTEEIALDYISFIDNYTGQLNTLYELFNTTKEEFESVINSVEAGNMAVSQTFGKIQTIGISQKTLTELIDKLMNNVDSVTDNNTFGTKITTNFTLFNKGTTNVATIEAECLEGTATSMKLYANDELIYEEENCESITFNYSISNTTEFTVVAEKTNGLTHVNKKVIECVPPVYCGAGSNYSEVVTSANIQSARKSPSGYYTIVSPNNKFIFFVVPATMTIDKFKLMDFQMPFEKTATTTISGVSYDIWKSEDTYEADTYEVQVLGNDTTYKTIDINIVPLVPDENTITVVEGHIVIKDKGVSKNKLSDALNNSIQFCVNGATSARPENVSIGYMYFDTTLSKPIWKTSSGWVDAYGNDV